jgi:hypothetical protein
MLLKLCDGSVMRRKSVETVVGDKIHSLACLGEPSGSISADK